MKKKFVLNIPLYFQCYQKTKFLGSCQYCIICMMQLNCIVLFFILFFKILFFFNSIYILRNDVDFYIYFLPKYFCLFKWWYLKGWMWLLCFVSVLKLLCKNTTFFSLSFYHLIQNVVSKNSWFKYFCFKQNTISDIWALSPD